MVPATYEVKVAGVVPEQDLLDLGAVAIASERASTVLYGEIPDQAALHGLLARLRALGLEVVEVRQILDHSAPAAGAPADGVPADGVPADGVPNAEDPE